MNIVALVDGLANLARAALRAPLVDLRLLAETPSAWLPALAAVLLVTIAAWQDRHEAVRGRSRHFTEVFAVIFGLAMFVWFFHGGRYPWTDGDWREEWTFFTAWKQALGDGMVPYYLGTAMQGTERYLANPQTPLMPYVVALAVVDVNTFLFAHIAIVYSIGFLGAVALRRELELGLLPWAAFLLIFTLNGHIVAHLSAGHLPWVAYFLSPWMLVSAVRVSRGDRSLRNLVACAATLAGMILIGGWHVFVWSLLFLAASCLAQPRRIAVVLVPLGLLTAALAAVRLAPGVVTYGAASNVFVGGYPSALSVLAALVATPVLDNQLDPWELDAYVGYVGLVVLCLGMIPFVQPTKRFLNALLLPAFALIVLSMGDVYERTLFRLPGFVSERVTTRFIVVGVLWLALAGCVRIDIWWRRLQPHRAAALFIWLGAAYLAVQLVLRAGVWRPHAGATLVGLPVTVLKPPLDEPLYYWAFWCGAAVSAISALAVGRLLRRPRPVASQS